MTRIAAIAALMLLSSAALASRCPLDMKAIDAAMPKHADSEAALGKAKGILGIQ